MGPGTRIFIVNDDEMIKPLLPEQEPNHIIDAGYKFAKKRFDREFRCEPSSELEAAIFKAIFGWLDKVANLRSVDALYTNLDSFDWFRLSTKPNKNMG